MTLGLLWGLATGHLEHSLAVGLFFELLWLDLFHAGTYIPPNGAASTLGALCLCEIWGLYDPPQALLPMAVCLPLAIFGARLENILRIWRDAAYNKLLHWARRSRRTDTPEILDGLIIRSLVQQAAMNALFLFIFLFAYWALFSLLGAPRFFHNVDILIDWRHIWLCGAIGVVLALRIKQAYMVFALTSLLATVLLSANLL